MPEIASDGIQVIDVTDFSILIAQPLSTCWIDSSKLNRVAPVV
jgi:hypothetical protein